MMSLLNGNALVTGAGSGIGRQLSLAYVRAGIQNITLGDMNKAGLEETGKMLKDEFPNAGVIQVTLDVTDETSVNGLIEQAVKAFGRLDCAVNAAGVIVNTRAKTADMPAAEYNRVMAINATSVALCTSAEAKVMLKQERQLTNSYWKDDRRSQVGSIVNIASVCGFQCMPNVMPYIASKHAVMGITRSAAVEHGAQGLRVNAVCPGIVDTPFLTSLRASGVTEQSPTLRSPMGRLCLPDEIADACIYLSSTMSSFVNGEGLVSDGGRSVEF